MRPKVMHNIYASDLFFRFLKTYVYKPYSEGSIPSTLTPIQHASEVGKIDALCDVGLITLEEKTQHLALLIYLQELLSGIVKG